MHSVGAAESALRGFSGVVKDRCLYHSAGEGGPAVQLFGSLP